jgi:fructosamine-3-kinase
MASLADLHARAISPNNKYGFSIPTFQRALPQYTEWADSREEFFSNSLKRVFEFEEKTHGSDKELKALRDSAGHVIPHGPTDYHKTVAKT